jgi:hypothetical protein
MLRCRDPNPAQARRETLRDKLARELEEHADEVVDAYLAGIRSDDPNRAYRAADAWISRVHGRPKETVENVITPDDPLDVASMSREQRVALKRELVRQHPDSRNASWASAPSSRATGPPPYPATEVVLVHSGPAPHGRLARSRGLLV